MAKELEFLDELPNKQQADPVKNVVQATSDVRVTEALDGGKTEPEKVDADKAIDTTPEKTGPNADPVVPVEDPAKVDQPELNGTPVPDVRPTKDLKEDQLEPERVALADALVEDLDYAPVPGKDPVEEALEEELVEPTVEEKIAKVKAKRGRKPTVKAEVAEEKATKKLNKKLAILARNRG